MKLLFVGDVMLGRLVNETLEKEPPEYVWGDTLPIFEGADFRMCNLECVISNKGKPWTKTPKVFHFRSDAKNIKVLKKANINAVSVANNHSLDYGKEALDEMLDLLHKANIIHTGAGDSFDEASAWQMEEIQGIKVGVIAFTDNEPNWEAVGEKPGIFYVPVDLNDERAKKLFEIVQEAKKEVDILIISAHWGPNWGYKPPKEHIPFARKLIDSGADIIFGHSSHVFRGIEIYKGRPIIYCAGDFIDDYAVDKIERNDQSFIFNIETEEKVIKSMKLYPTVIKSFQAQIAKDKQAGSIAEKMKNLYTDLSTEVTWNKKEECLELTIQKT